MANTYDKYKLTKKVQGQENLSNPVHEAVVHLTAESTSPGDIILILQEQTQTPITEEEISEILSSPLAQKRLAYKRKILSQKRKIPKTTDEMMTFAIRGLVKISRSASKDADKVNALKALASVAIDERKNGSQETPMVQSAEDQELLKRLTTKKESD